ncbi:unnamed protein product [Timema podura]|uniref:Major facilitator superfamily (MFS) profile domain-containing protein n=1 Tax=Timema podura TaxID=61482 RepID=A0ABN7NXC5_TIMPD|nr:unnamed protein product [Timema podura]
MGTGTNKFGQEPACLEHIQTLERGQGEEEGLGEIINIRNSEHATDTSGGNDMLTVVLKENYVPTMKELLILPFNLSPRVPTSSPASTIYTKPIEHWRTGYKVGENKWITKDRSGRDNSIENKNSSRSLLLPLFLPPCIYLDILLWFSFVSGNGLILWMPDLFSQLYVDYALHPVDQRTICQVVEHGLIASNQTSDTGVNCTNTVDAGVYQNTLIIGGVGMMAYIINGYFIDTVGKRNILVINLVTSGTAGIGLYFARSAGQVLTLACVFLALSSTCISVVSTAAIELFPTHLSSPERDSNLDLPILNSLALREAGALANYATKEVHSRNKMDC